MGVSLMVCCLRKKNKKLLILCNQQPVIITIMIIIICWRLSSLTTEVSLQKKTQITGGNFPPSFKKNNPKTRQRAICRTACPRYGPVLADVPRAACSSPHFPEAPGGLGPLPCYLTTARECLSTVYCTTTTRGALSCSPCHCGLKKHQHVPRPSTFGPVKRKGHRGGQRASAGRELQLITSRT